MIILGASIIFLTFVAKDVLKDQLKELIDTIEQAKEHYTLASNMFEIQQQLVKMNYEVGAVRSEISSAPTDNARRVANIDKILFKSVEIVETTFAVQQNLRPVLAEVELPSDEDYRKKAEVYQRDLATLDLSKIFETHTSDFDALTSRLLSEAEDLKDAADNYAGDVFAKAEEKQSKKQFFYKITAWTSYFLYLLGSGLALAGRLMGVETGTKE